VLWSQSRSNGKRQRANGKVNQPLAPSPSPKLLSHPSKLVRLLEPQERKYSAAELGDEVVDGLWPVIERRNDGKDHRACGLGTQHVLEVNPIKGSVAYCQHNLVTFLQANVGGALDERLRNALRDLRQAARGAGDHHHAIHGIRTTGDAGTDVRVQQVDGLRHGLTGQGRGDFRGPRNIQIQLLTHDLEPTAGDN